jgi:hypothetical protein
MTEPIVEDTYWIAKAREGEASGFVGEEASEEILEGILTREKDSERDKKAKRKP